MSSLPIIGLVTALALPLTGAAPDLIDRGCSTTRNGLQVPPFTGSIMVDGVILGDAPGIELVTSEDINSILAHIDVLYTWIGCLEVQRNGRVIPVRLVSFITREGAAAVIRSQLDDLVEAQESHRAVTGAYARAVTDLDFLASHPSPPIDVTMVDGNWVATMRLERDATVCFGSASLSIEGFSTPVVTSRCSTARTS